jgi:cobalamin-dependent methionine synthase I
MILSYDIYEVSPYINWVYFFFAWQVKDEAEQRRLRGEAEKCLSSFEGKYHTHALFQLFDAHSDGDDIVVGRSEEEGVRRKEEGTRIPCLRQQQADSNYLCLADFIAPLTSLSPEKGSRRGTEIGLFATSADSGLEHDFDGDPYAKMMAQLLADRLAEATAERLHEQVRKEFWGYAADEQLTIAEMQQERWQGIRPAVGYPSLPDASVNFILDRLLDFSKIGITLTESGAMRPHASVSGLMMAHPEARYFSVGKIGDDQLRDYARRRGLPLQDVRKFLSSNI